MFDVREDDLSESQTHDLLALHLAGMHANSPPESVFALDLSGLRTPDVTVWTAWLQGRVAAVDAMKMLSDGTAEVKSMRTHPDFTRMGAGSAILETIIATAKDRGVRRISLETGAERLSTRRSPCTGGADSWMAPSSEVTSEAISTSSYTST